MKIIDYKIFVLGTPWRNLTYFRLDLEDGTFGWGEARIVGKTHTVVEFLKEVRRHIVGHAVFDIEDLYRRFTLLDFGVAGEVTMSGLALVGLGPVYWLPAVS